MRLLDELKRRNVFRVAAAYAVVAWLVLQVGDVAADALGFPDWFMPMLFVLLGLGFPIALVLSWAFELTPAGLKKTKDVAEHETVTPRTGRRIDRLIVVGLVAVIAVMAVERVWFAGGGAEGSDPARADAGPGAADPAAADKSIAVLPFADLSPERDQEYFSDGLAEEILNLLASVRDLSVASRTSAFSFKGSSAPIPEIGERLGVRYVLEGSVRKAGERIRVTAQLIDVRTDRHLWSENYDRTLADVFAVQDEIAGAIGEALQVELLGVDGRIVATDEIAPALYEKFLQSRFLLRQRNQTSLTRATDLLLEVVEGEPDYAPGLAQLAEAYLLSGAIIDNDPDLQERLDLILGLVERALAIDPSQSGAFAVRGNVAMTRGDYPAAWRDLRHAIELDPGDPRPHHWLALVYSDAGHLDQADRAIVESLRLDSDNANAQGWRAMLLAARGDWNGALVAARRQAALGNPFGHVSQALILLTMDRQENLVTAEAELRMALGLDARVEEVPLEVVALARGDDAASDALVERAATDRLWLYVAGTALLALDQPAALLGLLERDGFLYDRLGPLVWSSEHAAMRRDPRFVDYLRRQGVVDLWREIGPPPDCIVEGGTFRCGVERES